MEEELKKDIQSWIEQLKFLQTCVQEPEKCKHDLNENGEVQPFDNASIDMSLDRVIVDMETVLSKL